MEKETERIQEIKSGIDGLLFAIRAFSYARPGCNLAKIVSKTLLKGKDKHFLTA
jgi:predicted deacylase